MPGLDWPPQLDRTEPRRRTENRSFEVDTRQAVEDLDAELDRMGVDDWRLSTDAEHLQSRPNVPKKRARPADPGAVLRWTMGGDQYAVGCDRYSRLRDNIRTIGLYVREKRKMDSRPVATGAAEFANARLPSGDEDAIATGPPPHEVLGVRRDAPDSVIEAAATERIKDAHPDQGGSAEELRRVRDARDQLLNES